MQPAPADIAPPGPNAAARQAAEAAVKSAGRERFASSFRKEPAAESAPDAPPPAEQPPAAEVDAAPEVEPDAPEADPADAPPPEPAEVKLDPATAKRMAASQKEEEKRRAQIAKERTEAAAAIAKERAAVEAERKEIEATRKELEDFKALRARAKYAPGSVLQHLGLSPEDMAAAAYEAWALSPEGAKDPKVKETAARMQREREIAGRAEKADGGVAELRELVAKQNERIEQLTQRTGGQPDVEEYLNEVEDAIGDEHPALSRALTSAKAKAADRTAPVNERREARQAVKALRAEFVAVAHEMWQRDGAEPDPVEVAAEVESRRVTQMKRWGFDPTAPAPAAAPAAAPKKAGAPPAPPKILARGNPAPTPAAPKLTPEQAREKFMRDRAAGKIGAEG